MSTLIQNIEREQLRKGLPDFDPGDRVRVHFQVVEGNRRRTQVFEGVVLRRQGAGSRETFTVRKQSFGVGVERTFPLHSPKIEQLEIASRGDVRRAKLYYLRGRVGKAARVTERRWAGAEDLAATRITAEEPPADEQPDAAVEDAATEQSDAADEQPQAEATPDEGTATEDAAAEQPAEEQPAGEDAAEQPPEDAAAESDAEAGPAAEAGEADEKTG